MISAKVLPCILLIVVHLNWVEGICERYGNHCTAKRNGSTIYFGLMLSYPDPLGRNALASVTDDGHDIAPAAYLAVEQINNRSHLLSDYQIKLLPLDGGCTVTERTVIGINNLACSCEPVVGIIGMYPAAPIKESMLLINTTKTGSYDYLSKYGSDWLGHVTCLHNYYCYATPVLHHTTPLHATPCNTTATPYIYITTRCYTIHLYYYMVLHHTFLLLHGTTPYISITTRCYTIHFYYYTVLHHTFLLLHGATPYISITTRCYTIHLYYYTVLHHTFLLLHGATPYISITTRCYTIHFYYYTGATPYISITTRCYTIHFYYYTVLHHTFLLLHGTTPYISITTRVLHHTFLLLHGATPYISITTRYYTIHFYYYTALHHTFLIYPDSPLYPRQQGCYN